VCPSKLYQIKWFIQGVVYFALQESGNTHVSPRTVESPWGNPGHGFLNIGGISSLHACCKFYLICPSFIFACKEKSNAGKPLILHDKHTPMKICHIPSEGTMVGSKNELFPF